MRRRTLTGALAVRRKRRAELGYWRERARAEGGVTDGWWYAAAFTAPFGLTRADFAGARMLDVGCGPRGSLEWATGAARRVGVDPLADEYVRLNGGRHAMEYVRARAEALPFADASFDIVSSFNALDHVEDPGAAIAELARVLAPGGRLLLLVEVGHAPTPTEPVTLRWDVVDRVAAAGLVCERQHRVAKATGLLYPDLEAAVPVPPGGTAGWLAARFRRGG